jgi:hypothetical protein
MSFHPFRGLDSNRAENRVKDLDRELDDHVPGVLRLVQHTDIGSACGAQFIA